MILRALLSITDFLALLAVLWTLLGYLRVARRFRAGTAGEEEVRRARSSYAVSLAVFLVLLFAILWLR